LPSEIPPLDLSAARVLCNFHPLPWKETWSSTGTMVEVMSFTLALFNILLADEDFISKCGGQAEAISDNMPLPLCCWVATNYPEKLDAAYREMGKTPPDASEIARDN
jgi:hypothetical protein